MTYTYTYINLTLMHGAFYCSIQPWILVVGCISIILAYTIKKYLLLRRYTAPKKLHRLVFDHSNVSVSYTPLMFGLGALLSTLVTHKQYEIMLVIPSALLIFLSIVNIMNPKELFDRFGDGMYTIVKKTSKRLNQKMLLMRMPKFERELEYYEVNELKTLFGYTRIIQGQDVT